MTTSEKTGLTIERYFSTEGVHPYDEVEWERRDVVMKNWRNGEVNFEQYGVEFPKSWSMNATTIVTNKYFRGAFGTEEREWSLKQLIDRVVGKYVDSGYKNGYFATTKNAHTFEYELKWLLLHQYFAFNSPVWFNVGTDSPQQVSACFILAVEDSMEDILGWYREEGLIFKGGSGSGINLSRIRSSKELLSSGGTASGPVSFMRGADASAGTIKSGGATRRAAKMVVLDVDHPDIEEFVETKRLEEYKIKALRDAGFDVDLGGSDMFSVQYQNANNSVRVTDEFMHAVGDGYEFDLTSRTTGEKVASVEAWKLFRQIATAAWECADPGLQYDGAIQDWNTCSESGRISASNPCSEYMHLDNSSCNLASINLLKFLGTDNGIQGDHNANAFDVESFVRATELIFTAMDISIEFADFPTDKIAQTTRAYRQLGIGYANLGALLMATGRAYDSRDGAAYAATITSLMTAVSYRRSAELAEVLGSYEGYQRNERAHRRVTDKHRKADLQIASVRNDAQPIKARSMDEWYEAQRLGIEYGYRNAQASLLAPTGTIGFMMDCDTTGIEPDFALVKHKKLVGGGDMQIVNQGVPRALHNLGYSGEVLEAAVLYVEENGTIVGAPGIDERHYGVFACAVGDNAIAPMGHVRMMAAVQPFLSGAISKTVNMPESATVEDVEEIYLQSWKMGLKALAIYRDNCKVGQPLSTAKKPQTVEDVRIAIAREVADAQRYMADVQTAGAQRIAEAERTLDDVEQTLDERQAELNRRLAKAEEMSKKAVADWPIQPQFQPARRRMPKRRRGLTTSFSIAGADGYLTTGEHEDGTLGEIFVKMSKQGSTLAGIMDAFSIAVSVALQHGVPLETFVRKYVNLRFEPAGMTDDSDLRMTTSILDYLFRRLALDYLSVDDAVALGIRSADERAADLADDAPSSDAESATPEFANQRAIVPPHWEPPQDEKDVATKGYVDSLYAPLCFTCGVGMRRAGSCYVCESCGSTSGCS